MKTLSISLLLSVAACAGETTQTRPVANYPAQNDNVNNGAAGGPFSGTRIAVDQSIIKSCGTTPAGTNFATGESNITAPDPALDALAQCLTTGALKDRNIRVVGYTDNAGGKEHNKDLSQARAEAVKNYLATRGVKSNNIIVASRGEKYARGNDEESRAFHRRVDISIAD